MLYQDIGQNFNIHHYKKLLSTKWQWVNFIYKFKKIITFERSKKTKKKLYKEVVLDQLCQLMELLLTISPKDNSCRQNFGRPPKKQGNKHKIQDIYHMKEHLICYKMTPESSLNSLWVSEL